MRRPSPPREIPPPLELACMRALWKVGEGSVKEVADVMGESRKLAYTTVLTLLDRLARRGFASRRKSGRAFVYAPVLDEERARAIAVQAVLDEWFAGSGERLGEYLRKKPKEAPEPEPEAPRVDSRSSGLDLALL